MQFSVRYIFYRVHWGKKRLLFSLVWFGGRLAWEGKWVSLEGFYLTSRQGLLLGIQISLSHPGLSIGNPDLPG